MRFAGTVLGIIAICVTVLVVQVADAETRRDGNSFNVHIPTFPQSNYGVPAAAANFVQGKAEEQTLYSYLDGFRNWVLSVGYGVHQCEEGGVPNEWYVAGGTSDGYFEGGMGLNAGTYQQIAGHSALLDTPEQQIWVAWQAHSFLGARWASKCEAIASQWP